MSNQEEAQNVYQEQSKLSGQKCRICEYQAPFIKRICRALKGMNRETLELLIQEFYNMGKESVENPMSIWSSESRNKRDKRYW